uniref:Uncharacterized protein n=1 Tax=Anguilla anguilla TaxID=7936 RepID=A0A0E9PWD8_ANGAN
MKAIVKSLLVALTALLATDSAWSGV